MKSNSPQKIKWRLNLFDVIIICFVIAAAAVFLILTSPKGGGIASGEDVTAGYKIELVGMTPEAAQRIKVGDVLIDNIKKYTIGTVVSVEIVPSEVISKNMETGEHVLAVIPEEKTVIIELTAEAVETDTGITVAGGGFVLRSGLPVSAAGPGYAGSGYIIFVERDGEGK